MHTQVEKSQSLRLKPGMPVLIDEPHWRRQASGTITRVEDDEYIVTMVDGSERHYHPDLSEKNLCHMKPKSFIINRHI